MLRASPSTDASNLEAMSSHSLHCPRCGEKTVLGFRLKEIRDGTLVDIGFVCSPSGGVRSNVTDVGERCPEGVATMQRDLGFDGFFVLETDINWPGVFVDADGNILPKTAGTGGGRCVDSNNASAVDFNPADLDDGPDDKICQAPGVIDLCESDCDNIIDLCSDSDPDPWPLKSTPSLSAQSSQDALSPEYAVGVTYCNGGDLGDSDFDDAAEAGESSVGTCSPDITVDDVTSSYSSTEEAGDCMRVHAAHYLD